MDRATQCILGWAVTTERSENLFQQILDGTPQAMYYYSDALPTYEALLYHPGHHTAMNDKSQTYSVEGHAVDADLRHRFALLVWHVAHVVFLVVQTLYAPPFICSFSVTTVDSFTSNVTLTTQLILSVSYRFGFEHSPPDCDLDTSL